MISSTQALEITDQAIEKALAAYDEAMTTADGLADETVEATKVELSLEDDVIQVAAENIVFAAACANSNIALLENSFDGLVVGSPEEVFDFNRILLARLHEVVGAANHLSQLLAEIYSAVVAPLPRSEDGTLSFPDLDPSEAVEKVLANFGRTEADTVVDL